MVKNPHLVPTLEAEGYQLLMHNRPSQDYDVMQGSNKIGRIRTHLKCVQANTGTEISFIPYDMDITILDGPPDMPVSLFKKIIMVTITMS